MTIRLKKLIMREIKLALREPFTISSGTMVKRRILLLELIDADGVSTWSECVADDSPHYSPETVDTARAIIAKWIAPRLLGSEFEDPRAVYHEINRDIRGHNMAKAALEMGCWALEALHQGKSLSELLGGTRSKIVTGISIGIQADPATLVKKARAAFAEGYPKIKIKIKPGKDLAYLAAVREALGPDVHLMADANNAYTTADFNHLCKMDEFGLLMLEQPLDWEDVFRHAELQKRMKTPICLDESIRSAGDTQLALELGSGRIINIKPGRVGGLASSKKIHDLCGAVNVPVWCGGMLEAGIGRAYNLALAALPNFTMPGDISESRRYWAEDIVEPEFVMKDGMMPVPAGPGLGVEIRTDRIEELTVQRWEKAV